MLNPKRGAPSSTDKHLHLDLEPLTHKIVAHRIANVTLALNHPIIRLYGLAHLEVNCSASCFINHLGSPPHIPSTDVQNSYFQ